MKRLLLSVVMLLAFALPAHAQSVFSIPTLKIPARCHRKCRHPLSATCAHRHRGCPTFTPTVTPTGTPVAATPTITITKTPSPVMPTPTPTIAATPMPTPSPAPTPAPTINVSLISPADGTLYDDQTTTCTSGTGTCLYADFLVAITANDSLANYFFVSIVQDSLGNVVFTSPQVTPTGSDDVKLDFYGLPDDTYSVTFNLYLITSINTATATKVGSVRMVLK